MKLQRATKRINTKKTYLFSYGLIKKITNNNKPNQKKGKKNYKNKKNVIETNDDEEKEIDNILSYLPGISVDQDGDISFSNDCLFFNTLPESQEERSTDPESVIEGSVSIPEIAVTTCTEDTSAISISDDNDDDINAQLFENNNKNYNNNKNVILTLNSENLPQVISAQPLIYNQEERIDHGTFIKEITKLARAKFSLTEIGSDNTEIPTSA